MPATYRHHMRCRCVETHAEHAAGARPFAFASTTRKYEPPRPFRVTHLALDITLDVATKAIEGEARLHFERIDPEASEMVLDAIGFELRGVHVGDRATNVAYDGERIRVPIGHNTRHGELRVRYRVTPRKGMYFLAPDEWVRDRPNQVWTQCQEEDARHWLPCHDKPHMKMTTEIRATVPSGWRVLSNGDLVDSSTVEGEAWVFHWKMNEPHPSYLLTLVAGEFDVVTDEASEVPLTYWVPKGRAEDGTLRRGQGEVGHR